MMEHAIVMLLYSVLSFWILILLTNFIRRVMRAVEEIAAANTRQAQALEVLASRGEMANRSKDDSDAVRQ